MTTLFIYLFILILRKVYIMFSWDCHPFLWFSSAMFLPVTAWITIESEIFYHDLVRQEAYSGLDKSQEKQALRFFET